MSLQPQLYDDSSPCRTMLLPLFRILQPLSRCRFGFVSDELPSARRLPTFSCSLALILRALALRLSDSTSSPGVCRLNRDTQVAKRHAVRVQTHVLRMLAHRKRTRVVVELKVEVSRLEDGTYTPTSVAFVEEKKLLPSPETTHGGDATCNRLASSSFFFEKYGIAVHAVHETG